MFFRPGWQRMQMPHEKGWMSKQKSMHLACWPVYPQDGKDLPWIGHQIEEARQDQLGTSNLLQQKTGQDQCSIWTIRLLPSWRFQGKLYFKFYFLEHFSSFVNFQKHRTYPHIRGGTYGSPSYGNGYYGMRNYGNYGQRKSQIFPSKWNEFYAV